LDTVSEVRSELRIALKQMHNNKYELLASKNSQDSKCTANIKKVRV